MQDGHRWDCITLNTEPTDGAFRATTVPPYLLAACRWSEERRIRKRESSSSSFLAHQVTV